MRNPSPPPLTEDEKEAISADYIGDSLFSKKWVLATMYKLYKHDINHIYHNEKNEQADEKNEQADIEVAKKLDLNEKFEEEICELWDISANTDVALFLYENQGKDILIDTLENTCSPRLMEISFGILGNLMCVDRICISFCSDEKLQETLFSYLKITDALSLVELTRTIFVCLSNQECLPLWFPSFCLHVDKLVYILQNTLNIDLLEHVINIVDIIFDASDDIIESCVNSAFLLAIQDAYSVLQNEKRGEIITTLVHTLQLVSTVNKGVILLSDDISIGKFLRVCLSDYENGVVVIEQRDQFSSSIFSTLNCILSVKPHNIMKLLNENICVLSYLIACLCNRMEHSGSVLDDDEIYIPIYMELLYDVYKTSTKMSHDDDDVTNILKCLKDNEEKLSVLLKNSQHSELSDDVKRTALNITDTINTGLQ